MDSIEVAAVVAASQVTTGFCTEGGKKLLGSAVEISNRALRAIRNECTAVNIASEVVQRRAVSFLTKVGSKVDAFLGLPQSHLDSSNPFEDPDSLLTYSDALKAAIRTDSDSKQEVLSSLVAEKFSRPKDDSASMALSNAVASTAMLSPGSLRACAATFLFSHETDLPDITEETPEEARLALVRAYWTPVLVPLINHPQMRLVSADFDALVSSRCALDLPTFGGFKGRSFDFFINEDLPDNRLKFCRSSSSMMQLTDIGMVIGRSSFRVLTGYELTLDVQPDGSINLPVRFSLKKVV